MRTAEIAGARRAHCVTGVDPAILSFSQGLVRPGRQRTACVCTVRNKTTCLSDEGGSAHLLGPLHAVTASSA